MSSQIARGGAIHTAREKQFRCKVCFAGCDDVDELEGCLDRHENRPSSRFLKTLFRDGGIGDSQQIDEEVLERWFPRPQKMTINIDTLPRVLRQEGTDRESSISETFSSESLVSEDGIIDEQSQAGEENDKESEDESDTASGEEKDKNSIDEDHELDCSLKRRSLFTFDDAVYSSGPPKNTVTFGLLAHSKNHTSLRHYLGKGVVSVGSPLSYETARSGHSSYQTAPLSSSALRAFGPHGDGHNPERKLHRLSEIVVEVPTTTHSDMKQLANHIVSEARTNADLMLGIDWKSPKSNVLKELSSFTWRGFTDPSHALAERVADEIHQVSPFEELDDREHFERFTKEALDEFVESHRPTQRKPPSQVFSSEWLEHLHTRGILLDPKDELNWSGRGQHIEYATDEAKEIPLQTEKVLGHSATALVESVICRRIRLARKSIRCSKRLSKEDAVIEVEHLQRLPHFHIVRVVGTYTFKRDFAILLYPVAEWNLEEFMDDTMELEDNGSDSRRRAIIIFFGCLTRTMQFLHGENVKHMDIKPKNILVRHMGHKRSEYKVYLADFGIARAYQTPDQADTESPTSYTRTYAAPEVVLQEKRGFSADIFSLGCVFLEMVATLAYCKSRLQNERHTLQSVRVDENGDTSYQANIGAVRQWLQETRTNVADSDTLPTGFSLVSPLLDILPQMVDELPQARPEAWVIEGLVERISCSRCHVGLEPFEAARPWAD